MDFIETEAGDAVAEGPVVVLDGPGTTAATMTPEAAYETAKNLAVAARDAEIARFEGARLGKSA